MKFLLRLARGIDWLNEQIGRVVLWLILVAVLISAGNAIIRKTFDMSSNAWLEVQWYLFSAVFLLLPAAVLIAWLAWPVFMRAFVSGEMSENAGGLIRWPVYILAPTGFALLALQGISELIKRFAFLQGLIEDPTRKKQRKSAEEELAEEIREQAERDLAKKQAAARGDGG